MKLLLTTCVALLIGLAVGAYVGYRSYDRHVANEALQQLVESGESSDRERAARAVRAIEMIEAGKGSEAVELLSRPIADYYRLYASGSHNDEGTRKVLAMIEQLASTNAMVSNAIHSKSQ
jgi:hypothetical protein